MSRIINCKNEDGIELVLTDSFSPFLLADADGLYTVINSVVTSANTMTDGSTYQGSVMQQRNIILTLRDKPDANHQTNRNLLYRLFKKGSLGTLTYQESAKAAKRVINYYPEKIDVDSVKHSRTATISLICPDPSFEDEKATSIILAGWSAGFQFPFQIPQDEGIVFGERIEQRTGTITNESASDDIGITAVIEVTGDVTNPTITHIEKNQHITVGTATKPLNLVSGDVITITTGTNNKHVYLAHAGTQTEINEYLTEDSEFIQLESGVNSIGYSAELGQTYMVVTISFKYKYDGV